ncbi:MAG: PAS domain S-box protein [Bacteroidota bacterium]
MIQSYPDYPPSSTQYAALLEELDFLYNQDRFRLITTNAPMGICLCSIEGEIQYANLKYSQIVGYSREELLGKKFADFTYKPDLEWNLDLYHDVIEGRKDSATFEKRYIHKKGHIIWCRLFISQMWKIQLENKKIISFIEDITEAKQTELALQTAQVALQNHYDILDKGEGATNSGSVIYDAIKGEGKFSRGLEALLGYPFGTMSEERYYHDLMACTHPEDIPLLKRHLSQIPQQKKKVSYDYRIIWPDGQIRWVRVRRDRYLNDHTVFTSFQDITEEKEAQLKLLETQTELERFVYSISHDLKTPLTHMTSYAKWLEEEGGLSSSQEEKIDIIIRSASRVNSMIDDLLHHSRRSAMVPFKRNLNLNYLLQTTQQMFRYETKSRNIQWHLDPMPTVFADHQMMRLVFDNLLSNAVKYSSKTTHPRICIRCQEENEFYVFSVQDNGIGFDSSQIDGLFKVFHRLDNASDFPGNGIGLANVNRIIKLHEGSVWAKGELNQGASFFFSLPRIALD